MARPPSNHPTSAEVSILRILWARGPSTVRDVFEELNKTRRTGYTTVLKLMQIMLQKGRLRREESQRTHVYHPTVSEQDTQKRLVRDLLDRVFAGSAQKLILRALDASNVSKRELGQLRKMLDDYERGKS
jgi:BlaI family transcriptional regulator, penicillinase repressor